MHFAVRGEAALRVEALVAGFADVGLRVLGGVLVGDEAEQLRQVQVFELRQEALVGLADGVGHDLFVLYKSLHLYVDAVEHFLGDEGSLGGFGGDDGGEAGGQVVDHVDGEFDLLSGELDAVEVDEDVLVVDFNKKIRFGDDAGGLREHDAAAALQFDVADEFFDLFVLDVALVVFVFKKNVGGAGAPQHEIAAGRVCRGVFDAGGGESLGEDGVEHVLGSLPLELRGGLVLVQELAHFGENPLGGALVGGEVLFDGEDFVGDALLVGLHKAEERVLERAELGVQGGDELADVVVGLDEHELLEVALDGALDEGELVLHFAVGVVLSFWNNNIYFVDEGVGVLAQELGDAVAVFGVVCGDDELHGLQKRLVVFREFCDEVVLQIVAHTFEFGEQLALHGGLHEGRHVLREVLDKAQQN